MAKKTTKAKAPRDAAFLETKVRQLQKENRELRKRVCDLELAACPDPAPHGDGEIVTVAVGPVMPWETALPNSFKVT